MNEGNPYLPINAEEIWRRIDQSAQDELEIVNIIQGENEVTIPVLVSREVIIRKTSLGLYEVEFGGRERGSLNWVPIEKASNVTAEDISETLLTLTEPERR